MKRSTSQIRKKISRALNKGQKVFSDTVEPQDRVYAVRDNNGVDEFQVVINGKELWLEIADTRIFHVVSEQILT